ncbi:recombinase-like helix-turn-helix domain-containing protein [Paraburkholderia sp. J63]|uniref:recombinase-like helix-turn-helix domain-containing protein n=1 Tax=Paraburkholderia sp. J63 TaxID=2805434 RepID=UPI002ABD44F5|nr:recombinase-like helix-turn-helix domain-containing protein [Paraburkholderia sp. J63]
MERYLEPHQARRRAPTQYESLLGDAIERAYAQGLHDLSALVRYLNETGPGPQDGMEWTEAVFEKEMARLAAD